MPVGNGCDVVRIQAHSRKDHALDGGIRAAEEEGHSSVDTLSLQTFLYLETCHLLCLEPYKVVRVHTS
jgi:hypothetical protein